MSSVLMMPLFSELFLRTFRLHGQLLLALTGMYNVLEKLRTGDPLPTKEQQIHDQGLVTLFQQIHGELDAPSPRPMTGRIR